MVATISVFPVAAPFVIAVVTIVAQAEDFRDPHIPLQKLFSTTGRKPTTRQAPFCSPTQERNQVLLNIVLEAEPDEKRFLQSEPGRQHGHRNNPRSRG